MTKITIDRASVELALEALELIDAPLNSEMLEIWEQKTDLSIAALRQALEQPNEFTPDWDQIKPFHDRIADLESAAKTPAIDKSAAIRIATALGWEPRREWVGLTDEEITSEWAFADTVLDFSRSLEVKLKERNT